MKNRTKKRCLLCGESLRATSLANLWEHPASEKCAVRITDEFGISADDRFYFEDGQIWEVDSAAAPAAPDPVFDLDGEVIPIIGASFVAADLATEIIFDNAGVPRLGGASGDRGWSSISTYQKCPYLWKRRYISGVDSRSLTPGSAGPPALEIGSITHTLLAIYYMRMIDPSYALGVHQYRDNLIDAQVTPDHVTEAWRLYEAYQIRYSDDVFVPLAVEHHLVDPSTGRSCRYDAIMRLDVPLPGLLPGTYIWDHKTKSRFDAAMLKGWANDGELLGQWDLYEKLKLEKRFGPLVGMCANVIGRQKEPKFERVWLHPSDSLLREHRRTTAVWSARLDLAKVTNDFPRARAACSGTYGLCSEFDHCTQEMEVSE